MNHYKELNGAIRLVTKFDTLDDDNTIDKIICHAIDSGLDIETYDEYDDFLIDNFYI